MKKNYISKLIIPAIALMVASVSCRDATISDHAGHEYDSSIVAMTSAVNSEVLSRISTVAPQSGMKIFSIQLSGTIAYDKKVSTGISSRVGGRIENLAIRYNYQPVKKGQVIMEIYSPDLAAAQRELIYLVRSREEEAMIGRAEKRLQLLGMRPQEINKVIVTGEVMYRVPVFSNRNGYIFENNSSGEDRGSAPLMLREGQYVNAGQTLFNIAGDERVVAEFAVQPDMAAKIRMGQRILIHPQQQKDQLEPAVIGLLEPVYRDERNFSIARVYLNNKKYKVGQLVTASVPVIYRGGWWLPKKAVWRSGTSSIVFRKQNGVFKPVEISVAAEINEMVQIKANIGDWHVASNAAYLVDSEGFIQPLKQSNEK